ANYVFKLPDVGEGTAEAELVGWHVKVGDAVEEDQIIADIMTDKATVEIASPVAGTVVALHGEAGQQVPVGGPPVSFAVEGAGQGSAGAGGARGGGGGGRGAGGAGGGAAAPPRAARRPPPPPPPGGGG